MLWMFSSYKFGTGVTWFVRTYCVFIKCTHTLQTRVHITLLQTVSYHKRILLPPSQTRADASRSHSELWFSSPEVPVYVHVATQSLCACHSEPEVSSERLIH